ncbi:MAG: hypothetical protein II948_00825 [Synergistaceae bacterium]|nr:hypothetical protein [Synergistaceae bacterium]MBQ4418015.1 hypothetical protein [Synergistaceae bacterium]MBQ6740388.1 hypothetical protein [Synergistaceae bacterium]MBQ6908511.1 hypothetical protein [Synergistaceae bacterium]MBR0044794.1 hypothetical protein [Synergistaceae bacterium]
MDDEEYQGALGDWGDEEYDGALGNWDGESSGGGEESGAIADVDSGDIIHFKINPESIEDSKDTSYANIEIPGMSHPRYQFTGGGERVLSFSIYLHEGAGDDVGSSLKLLRSWLYADYSEGKLNDPPKKLLIIFGDNWPDEVWLLRSLRITHNKLDKSLNSIYAEAELEFIEFIDESIGAGDVRA